MREQLGRRRISAWRLAILGSALSVGLAGCAQVSPLVSVGRSLTGTDQQAAPQSQVLALATAAPTLAPTAKPTAVPASAPGVRTTTVRRGSIADVILLNGRVAGVDETSLTVASRGTVDGVYVQPGQTVSQGQVLLDLDSKQLQKDVTSAQARAAAAADALQKGREQTAQLQRQATERRDSSVADAQARVRQAQADLDKVRAGASQSDRQGADTAVLLAQNGLDRAQADLAKATAGPDPSAVRSAQQLVATTQLALQSAQADQAKLQAGPDAVAVREAERAVAVANASLLSAQTDYDKLVKGADTFDIRAAERAVQQAQASLEAAQAASAAPIPSTGGPAAPIKAQRDAAELQARLALQDAQDRLARLKQPPTQAAVQLARGKIEDAQTSVQAAQDRLDLLRKPADQLALDKARSAIDSAQTAYDNARAALSQLQSGPAADTVQNARGAVEAATAALVSAEGRQADVYGRPTDAELRDAQDKVNTAQQALDRAIRGVGAADSAAPDLKAFERALEEANAQLSDAQKALDATHLRAPSRGVVAQVLVQVGDIVDTTKAAIVLSQSTDPVVRVNLLDGDKPKRVSVGQQVKIQLDGSDTQLDGQVSTFAPPAANGDRIALVGVAWGSARPAIATGARVSITVEQKDNALLVPRRAIKNAAARTYVEALDGSTRKTIPVEVGIVAGTDAEILSGLSEGQSILLDSAIDSAATGTGAAAKPTAAAKAAAATPTAMATGPSGPSAPSTAATSAAPVSFTESFDDNARGWPSNPQGPAWVANGVYHLAPRQAGQFVAVGVPGTAGAADIVVSATFRKTGGPAGGGYGLILRDQDSARDGTRQSGQFYVFEVGDRGEVGVWLRDGDRWIDVLPWTQSAAVNRAANASNELSAAASGDELTFSVNGVRVLSKNDARLSSGAAGVFVGGDGNQVALEELTVRTAR